MPVGLALGGAAIGAAGAIGGSILSANAQKDAAQTAASTSASNAAANNELQREIYAQNTALAAPYYNNGLLAGNALTDLLLGTHTYNPAITANPTVPGGGTFPASATNALTGATSGGPPFTAAQIAAMKSDGIPGNMAQAQAANAAWYAAHPNGVAATPALTQPAATTPALGAQHAAGAAGQPATAQSAWDAFRNSTNYTFQLGEGQKALNSKFAANGTFDSGAEDKAAIAYNQNFAAGALSNYMNLLASQQASGLSASNAVMGVGSSYAGNVAAQNTAAANAAANAALASGAAQGQIYSGIGQGLGQIGGALFQYGMGGPSVSYAPASSGISVNGGTANYFQAHPFG